MIVPVTINKRRVNAVIDSGAQVSVISQEFHSSFKSTLGRFSHSVNLKTAGIDDFMKASLLNDIQIGIGAETFNWKLYVAPITDQCIIGLDFLKATGAVIDLENGTLTLNNNTTPAIYKTTTDGDRYKVSRVIAPRKIVVPPHTAVRCKVSLEKPIAEDVHIQPNLKLAPKLAIPHSLVSGTEPTVTILNLTDFFATVKKDQVVGFASQVFEVTDNDSQTPPLVDYEVQSDTDDDDDYISASEEVPNLRDDSETEDEDFSCRKLTSELPEHLQDMFEKSSSGLSSEEKQQFQALLSDYQDVFAKNDNDLGCFVGITHRIDTGDAKPVKNRLRRAPLGFESEEKANLDKMINSGVIRPANSEWSASPVLVRKKDGSVRWCLDYRGLNAVTVKDTFPLPLISDCIDTLSGSQFFSCLDAISGYWQIPVHPEDIHKTAFNTKYGSYEALRVPFGLTNAPATFQRAVQLMLRGLTWQEVLAYLDDVVVLGKDFKSHLQNLSTVLERFRLHNLKLKPRKCVFFQTEVTFLGRKVSSQGIQMTDEHVKVVKEWTIPTNSKQVESFLGFANYHREFVPSFAEIACPLYSITGKKPFKWESEEQQAFDQIKQALSSTSVLAYPIPNNQFILDTDASDVAIAAELSQLQDGQIKPIAYASCVLTPEQRRYCTTRKELLAIVKFTRHFRHYILGQEVLCRTDHSSLTWLTSFKEPTGQLARWLEELSSYNIHVIHRAGKLHTNADSLSRIPMESPYCNCYKPGQSLEKLPCKGCAYCRRCLEQWEQFENDVDDVIPLSVRRISDQTQLFGFSSDELRDFQIQDPDISPIIHWLESGKDPAPDELFAASPHTKYYWLNRNSLELHNNLLYYQWSNNFTKQSLFLVPKTLKEKVMQMSHDIPLSGHLGVSKTLHKIRMSCFWRGMSFDIKAYCKACHVCNKNKRANVKAKASMKLHCASFPMERVHLDVLGPLKTSQSGNNYILVMVDQFTKWVELVPLKQQTAVETAKAAVDSFFSRFGIPMFIYTDNGSNFVSNLFVELCRLLEINKQKTTPYRPASNAQVERYNRTLMSMIRCYVSKGHDDWDQHLQVLAGAIRSTIQRNTGFTPNRLMLGREVSTPLDIMLGTQSSSPIISNDYVRELSSAMSDAHILARQTLRAAQLRQKKDYDVKLVENSYEVGDPVYLVDSAKKVGEVSKLRSPWKGPYIVTEVISSILYRVKNRKKTLVVNHDRMKLCRDKEMPNWLTRIRNSLLNIDSNLSVHVDDIDHVDSVPNVDSCLDNNATDQPDIDNILRDISKLFKNTGVSPPPRPVVPNQPTTRVGRQTKAPAHLQGFVSK